MPRFPAYFRKRQVSRGGAEDAEKGSVSPRLRALRVRFLVGWNRNEALQRGIMPHPPVRSGALLLAACATILACGGAADAPPPSDAGDGGISWLGEIDIEENPSSLSVLPLVSLDPAGGFLVTDTREAQVRRYGPGGGLLWTSGRRGEGPGEYRTPSTIARLPDGRVLVGDRSGRITYLDSAGGLVRTARTPLAGLEDALVIDDSVVLLSARPLADPAGPRLHWWDARNDTLLASSFAPVRRAPDAVLATVAGWVKLARRGDTIAAIFAPADTVYYFAPDGGARGRVPIPFADRRSTDEPPPGRGSSARERAEWMSRFDLVADVHWLPGGDLLVAYQNSDPARASERRWHLLRMTPSGERVTEIRDVPRLLEVDPASGELYFISPQAEAPNRWSLARLP